MLLLRLFVVSVLCLIFSSLSQAQGAPDIYDTMGILWDEAEHGEERVVVQDASQRDKLVHKFMKRLEKFQDKGLGSIGTQKKEHQQDLLEVKQNLQSILQEYEQKVRPILLNDLKFKRKGSSALAHKVGLSRLMFPTKYNHKTKRPIAGIFNYKQNISSSMFSSKMVDAGLLVNFPELKEQAWVQKALRMDTELSAVWHMQRSYMDGVKFKRHYTKKSEVKVNTAVIKSNLSSIPDYKREKVVRKFVRGLEKLDDSQPFSLFRKDLESFLTTYENVVKPILVDNVNLKRFDVGAKANSGDLQSLFYEHKRNYYTGKPITSKLKHRGDSKKELGYLTIQPELSQDNIIKKALLMEKSLEQLLKEHKNYLKEDKSAMW